jgi:hypothetical protein
VTRGGSPYVAGAEGCIGLMGLAMFWLLALAAVAWTLKALGDGDFAVAIVAGLISAGLLWIVLGGHIDDYRVRQRQQREQQARDDRQRPPRS